MERAHLPPELRELVDRVAAHPHGLGFLNQAYLESVAVTLGVHPFVVAAAREYMATPEGRAVMIEAVRLGRGRAASMAAGVGAPVPAHTIAAAPAAPSSGDAEPEPPAPKGARDLIAEVRRHPLGLRFLLEAPPETVAVTFAVHPFVVFRARGLLSGHEPGARVATSAEPGGGGVSPPPRRGE